MSDSNRTRNILIAAAAGAGLGILFGRPAIAAASAVASKLLNKITSDTPSMTGNEIIAYQNKLNWFYDTIAGIKPAVSMPSSGLSRIDKPAGTFGPKTRAATDGMHDLLIKAVGVIDTNNLANYAFIKAMADSAGGIDDLADQGKVISALAKYDGRMSNYDLQAFGKALGVNVALK